MQLFSAEWKQAIKVLHDTLKPYFSSADMGAVRYVNGSRVVTVKHRLTKNKSAVDSIGCWLEKVVDRTDVTCLWFYTTATPEGEAAAALGEQLLAFLETEAVPSIQLATYPGYEDLRY